MEEEGWLSEASFISVLISFMREKPSRGKSLLSHLLKTLYPNTFPWGWGLQHMNLAGHRHWTIARSFFTSTLDAVCCRPLRTWHGAGGDRILCCLQVFLCCHCPNPLLTRFTSLNITLWCFLSYDRHYGPYLGSHYFTSPLLLNTPLAKSLSSTCVFIFGAPSLLPSRWLCLHPQLLLSMDEPWVSTAS